MDPAKKIKDGDGREKSRAHILNIVTPDVYAVAIAGKEVWYLVSSIISVIIGLNFLYYLLGASAWVGVGAIVLASPASYWVGRTTYREHFRDSF